MADREGVPVQRVVGLADLRSVGVAAGLHLVGAASAEPFDEARRILEERRAAGRNGSMQFTYRNPARSTDPAVTLPGARSIVVGARSYHRDPPPRPTGRGPVGAVARYVWADDQAQLLAGLGAIRAHLEALGYRACVVSDQNHDSLVGCHLPQCADRALLATVPEPDLMTATDTEVLVSSRDGNVYAVTSAGAVRTVASELGGQPRGLAWDGERRQLFVAVHDPAAHPRHAIAVVRMETASP